MGGCKIFLFEIYYHWYVKVATPVVPAMPSDTNANSMSVVPQLIVDRNRGTTDTEFSFVSDGIAGTTGVATLTYQW